MPMTPDEVVNTLKEMQKNLFDAQALTPIGTRNLQSISSAISLLQDYQKLRERVSVENVMLIIKSDELSDCFKFEENKYKYRQRLAQAIITYLQQPTEH
jgi:hypothetical protein